MSERRNKLSKKNRTKAYIAAGLVHVVIIGLMLFNFSTTKHETVDAADADKIDVVKAQVVDDSEAKKEREKIKRRDLEKKRQKKEEQRKKERRLEELKKKKADEQRKADELEKQRNEIALKKQKEEAERKKKEEEARKKRAADKKRKEELERIERENKVLESQRELDQKIADEEAFIAEQQAKERTVTLVQRHFALIGRKIESVRTVDPGFESWRKSVVDIKVSPSGVVQSVRTIESSGNARYDSSVEDAVFKASPLPVPDPSQEPDANNLLREFEFEVKHPSARR